MSQSPDTVAVLDDDPQLRKAMRQLLSSQGLQVREYECASDFLATLPNDPPDVLMLDLDMPGISGFDVLDALAESEITLPIIVITGHEDPATEREALAMGVLAYLRKPVDWRTLLSSIQLAMNARHLLHC